jgi:hypothetical protein
MSGEVAFELATREDDAGIRRLLAANPVPGKIRIRYEREPDYFAGCATMGATQVLVARANDQVVGVACRSIRPMFINGERADVGYLGQLRVDPRYHGRWLVLRGFRKLHDLHRQSPPRGYVTTIIEGNDEAEGVLVRLARGPMPRYRKLDRLMTLALPTAGAARVDAVPSTKSLGDIVTFLQSEGRRKNFFPVYEEQSFSDGTTRGFDPRDFIVIQRAGAILGVAGLWDQSSYKQSVVDAYDPLTRAARPFYNTAAKLLHRPALPKPGSALKFAYGSFFCVRDDDAAVAHTLIERLLATARERRFDHLLLGFAESDPLLAAACTFRHIAYPAGIYTVAWDDGTFHDELDPRPRYLEIASL